MKSLIDQYIWLSSEEISAIKAESISKNHFESLCSVAKMFKRDRLHVTWLKICPEIYDMTNLKQLAQSKLQAIKSTLNLGLGVYAHGKAGTHKTRSIFACLAEQHCGGKSISVLDGYYIAVLMRMDFADARKQIDHFCTTDILFIDDLFKSKISEAQESLLFEILERRTSRLKPIIITSELSPKKISAHFTEGGVETRADAIMRRIIENCKVLNFA